MSEGESETEIGDAVLYFDEPLHNVQHHVTSVKAA